SAIRDVDVILFLVDRLAWTEGDELVLAQLKKARAPVLLVINKTDLLDDKSLLLPHIEKLSTLHAFAEILPLSALKGHNVADLEKTIIRYLPRGEHLFPAEQLTDKSSRFLAAE